MPRCGRARRLPRPADLAVVRGERIQRGPADAAAHVRRTRSACRDVRADVRVALTHRGITGTEVVVGERAADFSIDVAAAEELLASAHPTVLFVCSPNNPTGTVDDRAQVEKLATLAAEHDALLVVDEAYGEFAPWSAVELVDESRPIVVVRTYSKVWSLAAIRLGFAVAPEWVVDELEKVALPYALSVPTLLAGEVALDFRTEMEVRVAALVEERGRLFAALAATSRACRSSRPVPTSCCSASTATPMRCGKGCWNAVSSCATSLAGRASSSVSV